MILALPVLLLIEGLRVKGRSTGTKFLVVGAVLVVGFIWWGSASTIIGGVKGVAFASGIWKNYFDVPVKGTSMLPTIKDGSSIKLTSSGGHKFERGDIVSFTNDQTNGLHFLKRIIGLPGESLTVKNGSVFIADKPLQESYIYQNANTFGNTYILDCEPAKIPSDAYVVMGDNRTVSWDSRAIGFVKATDIEGYVVPQDRPVISQTASPKTAAGSKLDAAKLINLINEKRKAEKVGELLPSSALTTLANERAQAVATNLDSWKSSQLPIEKTLDSKGYKYNLAYEFVTFGNLNEQGVVDQIWENPKAKDFVLSGRFWEGGLGIAEATRGDCTYPVISLVLTWPVVPSYSQDTINWWQNEANVTAKILGDLQSWKGIGQKDQTKLGEAISATAQMNEIANRVVKKMIAKEWLANKDYDDIKLYNNLVAKNNALLDELFPKVKGLNSNSAPPQLW